MAMAARLWQWIEATCTFFFVPAMAAAVQIYHKTHKRSMKPYNVLLSGGGVRKNATGLPLCFALTRAQLVTFLQTVILDYVAGLVLLYPNYISHNTFTHNIDT
jgi:hypothetical protein